MRSKNESQQIDLSVDLTDELDWRAGTLRTFEHHLDISAWSYEPLSGLLAIGTCLSPSNNITYTYLRYQRRLNRHIWRPRSRVSPAAVGTATRKKLAFRQHEFQATLRRCELLEIGRQSLN